MIDLNSWNDNSISLNFMQDVKLYLKNETMKKYIDHCEKTVVFIQIELRLVKIIDEFLRWYRLNESFKNIDRFFHDHKSLSVSSQIFFDTNRIENSALSTWQYDSNWDRKHNELNLNKEVIYIKNDAFVKSLNSCEYDIKINFYDVNIMITNHFNTFS